MVDVLHLDFLQQSAAFAEGPGVSWHTPLVPRKTVRQRFASPYFDFGSSLAELFQHLLLLLLLLLLVSLHLLHLLHFPFLRP